MAALSHSGRAINFVSRLGPSPSALTPTLWVAIVNASDPANLGTGSLRLDNGPTHELCSGNPTPSVTTASAHDSTSNTNAGFALLPADSINALLTETTIDVPNACTELPPCYMHLEPMDHVASSPSEGGVLLDRSYQIDDNSRTAKPMPRAALAIESTTTEATLRPVAHAGHGSLRAFLLTTLLTAMLSACVIGGGLQLLGTVFNPALKSNITTGSGVLSATQFCAMALLVCGGPLVFAAIDDLFHQMLLVRALSARPLLLLGLCLVFLGATVVAVVFVFVQMIQPQTTFTTVLQVTNVDLQSMAVGSFLAAALFGLWTIFLGVLCARVGLLRLLRRAANALGQLAPVQRIRNHISYSFLRLLAALMMLFLFGYASLPVMDSCRVLCSYTCLFRAC